MKRYFYLAILTLGISVSASASSCVSGGSLQSYITAGSCTFSGSGQTYTLDSFTFLAIGVLANTATASDIAVTETVGANGPVVTFTPGSALQVNSGLAASATYLFGFDIIAPGGLAFSSVNLNEHSTLTGLGSLGLVAEEDCSGGALPLPGAVNLLSLGSGGLACLGGGPSVGASLALTPLTNTNANANIVFSNTSNSVDVLKEVNLTGVLLGSAAVSGISQSFTTVGSQATPEPATFFMGGCGLVVLALIGRRKVKGNN